MPELCTVEAEHSVGLRSNRDLPNIPLVKVGSDFPLATLNAFPDRVHDLMDRATHRVPHAALRQLDRISRAWLKRWDNAHLDEIDAVAERIGRPGAYFFSVNYEWGCTCRVVPSQGTGSARLARVLDWRTPGLGRNVIAADVAGGAGDFVTLTWPGYTGVLSASAPGRFSAALNQAPMREVSGLYLVDWAANRRRVWSKGFATPSHVLRHVFETAPDFDSAKRMLIKTPISTPAIYLLAGCTPDETAVIERRETEAHVIEGDSVAANHWQAPNWRGRPRGRDSAGRAAQMHRSTINLDPAFAWVKPPILNDRTRLVMEADAALGVVVARGFEGPQPATQPLKIEKT